MAATSPARGRLCRLADTRPDHGRVLSVFFDLDPSAFATGDTRGSEGAPGGELQEREDVVEAAIEQSAEGLVLRDQPDLGPHGGVAAVLRF